MKLHHHIHHSLQFLSECKHFVLVGILTLSIGISIFTNTFAAITEDNAGYGIEGTSTIRIKLSGPLGHTWGTTGTNNRIEEHGLCYTFSKTDSLNYFVPTKTNTEFNAFLTNTPSTITKTTCTPACGNINDPCLRGTIENYNELGGLCGLGECTTDERLIDVSRNCRIGAQSVSCAADYCEPDPECGGSCFIQNTQIRIADGSTKNIEEIKVGDLVVGSQGINKVLKTIKHEHLGYIYAFNGGTPFVTDSHPIMTTEGRKSLNPELTKKEMPMLDVTLLEVGDTIIMSDGEEKITSISSERANTTVYNLSVDQSNDFYANGILVHNKEPI